MSTVATTARLQVNAGSPYAKHNGLIFPIAYHLASAVCLALPHGPYTVQTDFNLSEVELIGERPAHLVQPFEAAAFPAEFETEQSCWEGTHTSYVWQKSADYEKIVGETPKFYKVATVDLRAEPIVRRVAKTKLRFKAPAVAPAAQVATVAPGIDGQPTARHELAENAGFIDAEPTAHAVGGGWITLYEAAKQGLDVGGAPYAVVCEVHGNIGAASTYGWGCLLMAKPEHFCPDCLAAFNAEPVQLAEAGLQPWQRAALLDMAAGPETPADVRALLQQRADEQLVQAAGFVPMLPALLQSDLPASHPALGSRPLFRVGNQGPAARLPLYRRGLVYEVLFGYDSAAAKAFEQGLPRWVIAENHCYDITQPTAAGPSRWKVLVQCTATGSSPTAAKRGARFYAAMQALSDSLPPAPAPTPQTVLTEPLMQPRQFGTAAPKVPAGAGTGQLFA